MAVEIPLNIYHSPTEPGGNRRNPMAAEVMDAVRTRLENEIVLSNFPDGRISPDFIYLPAYELDERVKTYLRGQRDSLNLFINGRIPVMILSFPEDTNSSGRLKLAYHQRYRRANNSFESPNTQDIITFNLKSIIPRYPYNTFEMKCLDNLSGFIPATTEPQASYLKTTNTPIPIGKQQERENWLFIVALPSHLDADQRKVELHLLDLSLPEGSFAAFTDEKSVSHPNQDIHKQVTGKPKSNRRGEHAREAERKRTIARRLVQGDCKKGSGNRYERELIQSVYRAMNDNDSPDE